MPSELQQMVMKRHINKTEKNKVEWGCLIISTNQLRFLFLFTPKINSFSMENSYQQEVNKKHLLTSKFPPVNCHVMLNNYTHSMNTGLMVFQSISTVCIISKAIDQEHESNPDKIVEMLVCS